MDIFWKVIYPRPSHCPVLQHAETEWKDLVHFNYHLNDINVNGRQTGGGEGGSKEHISCMHSLSQTMSGKFSASQTFVTPALGKTIQEKVSNSIGDPPST